MGFFGTGRITFYCWKNCVNAELLDEGVVSCFLSKYIFWMWWSITELPHVFSHPGCGAAGVSSLCVTRRFYHNRIFVKFSKRVANQNRWIVQWAHKPSDWPRTDFPNPSAASSPMPIYLFELPVGFFRQRSIFKASLFGLGRHGNFYSVHVPVVAA